MTRPRVRSYGERITLTRSPSSTRTLAAMLAHATTVLLLKRSILTEKIARRGIHTPHSFEPDLLEKLRVEEINGDDALILSADNTIAEVRDWLSKTADPESNYFVVVNAAEEFIGTISLTDVLSSKYKPETLIQHLIKHSPVSVMPHQSLRQAVELMAKAGVEIVPIISANDTLSGILTFKDIMASYKRRSADHEQTDAHISLKRQSIRILSKGQKALTFFQPRKRDF